MSAVHLGVDRFLELPEARNKALGLVTNATGFTSTGVPTWRAFLERRLRVAALFGPEHGFRGEAQDAVQVVDEEFRGIPVYSLYGSRLRPTPEMLRPLDAVVYDIQDVGCRYYTYLYTLAYVMEACEKAGAEVIVLDRPNPIRADRVEGTAISAAFDSFVGGYGLSPRYGMTVGEFAEYLKGEYFSDVQLSVIWMEGYDRSSFFDETGLPWPLPSPNLPSLNTAILYPGTCLLEGTNLSEGRGTTRPFEICGAPWLDGEILRERLAAYDLPGVVFSSIFFTPTFSKHAGLLCRGVLVHVVDRSAVDALAVGAAILREARRFDRSAFEWRELWEGDGYFFDRLAGGPALRERLEADASLEGLRAFLVSGAEDFEERRARYLHYGSVVDAST